MSHTWPRPNVQSQTFPRGLGRICGQKSNPLQAKYTNKPEHWKKFRNLRNKVVSRIRAEKFSWEKSQLDHLTKNPSSLWKNVKRWMGWKSSGPPSKLFTDKFVTKPKEIATTMNKFFSNKVKELKKKIPPRKRDPLTYLKKMMEKRKWTFKLKPVHPDEVKQYILSLKNSKSTSLDTIDTKTIKNVLDEILPALTHIVNLSISHQEFPKIYKTSKVIPLLKKPKDDPRNPKFYRPVSLLPVESKILERAVFVQIINYMEHNNLLHPSHHSGRASHSTSTAIIEMYDQWVDAVDKGNMAGVMMLDLSAAYDLADHQVILDKLEI